MEKPDDVGTAHESFDLVEIQRIGGMLWNGRDVIVLMAVLSILLSALYLHMASYTYTTTMTLIPTQSQPRDIAGQFGGLASLAGINIPGEIDAISPFSVYPEAGQTRQVAADMIRNWPDVMPMVFKDQWDPQSRTWHAPRTLLYTISRLVKPVLGLPVYNWTPPGPAELQQYIVQNVGVSQDKKKALLTITLHASDPGFSKRFILTLHQSTDSVLRRMTVDRAKKYAAYLATQLITTQASAVRDVLTQSLSDQETQIMMGSSNTDFAAQPLGPPESSTRPTSPIPIFVIFVGLLTGVLIGGVCVVFGIPIFERSERLYKTKLGSRLIKFSKGRGLSN